MKNPLIFVPGLLPIFLNRVRTYTCNLQLKWIGLDSRLTLNNSDVAGHKLENWVFRVPEINPRNGLNENWTSFVVIFPHQNLANISGIKWRKKLFNFHSQPISFKYLPRNPKTQISGTRPITTFKSLRYRQNRRNVQNIFPSYDKLC